MSSIRSYPPKERFATSRKLSWLEEENKDIKEDRAKEAAAEAEEILTHFRQARVDTADLLIIQRWLV